MINLVASDSLSIGNSWYSDSDAPIIQKDAKEKVKPSIRLIHPFLRKICLISKTRQMADTQNNIDKCLSHK